MKRIFKLFVMAAAGVFAAASCVESANVEGEISASPSSISFSAEGETKNVVITSNIDNWTYSGEPEWVSITKEGNSLSVTAEANSELEPRSGAITLTANQANFIIELSQEKGSKYPGYRQLELCEGHYSGALYQAFLPDVEGASASLILSSEDGKVELGIEFFTEIFASAEETYLPEGTYTKGDSYEGIGRLELTGKAMTYVAGGSYTISDEEGDEEFEGGTMYVYTVGDMSEVSFLTDGTFTVSMNDDGTYLIKTDFTDAEGNSYKYYYEGELLFDASGAIYPSAGETDPTIIETELHLKTN